MPVTFDNSTAGFGLGTSINFSFTVTGSDPALILFANQDPNADGGTISGVTYNSVSLTDIGSSGVSRTFGKQGVSTGSNTVSISRTIYNGVVYAVASFAGVDSTTPFGTVTISTGSSSTPSTGTVTCPTDGMIYGAETSLYTSSPAPTINSGTLASSARSGGSGQTVAGGYRSTTGAVAWNLSSSASWRVGSVPINAAGGGGGGNVSVNLTGTSISLLQGNEIPSVSYTPAGIASTVSLGVVRSSLSSTLNGQATTTSTGTTRSSVSYGVTGQSVTISTGTIRSAVSQTLVGSSITTTQGSVSTGSDVSKALSGIALAINQGSVVSALSRALTGIATSVSAGSITNTVGPVLSGVSTTATAGTLSSAISRGLSGSSLTINTGTLSAVSGLYVTVKAGSWIRYRTI